MKIEKPGRKVLNFFKALNIFVICNIPIFILLKVLGFTVYADVGIWIMLTFMLMSFVLIPALLINYIFRANIDIEHLMLLSKNQFFYQTDHLITIYLILFMIACIVEPDIRPWRLLPRFWFAVESQVDQVFPKEK